MAPQKPQQSFSVLFVEKYIIPLLLGITMSILAGAVTLWLSVRDLTNLINQHDAQIKVLTADVQSTRAAYITRSELLETLKRVELQLDNVMLKARVQGKVKMTEE